MNDNYSKLNALLADMDSPTIAFSGGVDSTFLLGQAHRLLGIGENGISRVIAVTACGPNFAPDEIEYAAAFCRENGIRQILVDISDALLASFSHNPPDRCYICKKGVFTSILARLAAETGGRFTLADGTNADDADDYRPGRRALEELGVVSPLKEAGLTKLQVREGLRRLYDEGALTPVSLFLPNGARIWEKPAFACLASRIPYGEPITRAKLEAIYALEKLLRDRGFTQVRVRCHGELPNADAAPAANEAPNVDAALAANGGGPRIAVARIEVLPEERQKFFDAALMDEIDRAAREAGFTYAALDLAGYRMGSLNLVLK